MEEVKVEEVKVEEAKVGEKGNKGRKWIVGCVVLAVILSIWGMTMANEIFARVAPDKYVLLSLLETQKAPPKENEITKILQAKNKMTHLDLSLKGIDGIYGSFLNNMVDGIGISVDIGTSQDGDIKIDTAFQKDKVNLMNLNIYSSNSHLGIRVPEILDKYVMINLDQFKEQYDQSGLNYYGGNIEQDEVDLLRNSIDQIRNGILLDKQEDKYADLKEEYKYVFMDIAKDINVKYKGTKKIKLDNKSKKCTTFSINLDSGDIKGLIKGSIRATLKDKNIKQSIETLMASSGSYYTIDEWQEMIYEGLDEIKFSDIEIMCVIDNKRQIVNAEVDTAIQLDGERIKIQADYLLAGGDNIFDNTEANVRLKSEYGQVELGLETNKEYNKDKTKKTNDVAFRIREDKEQIFRFSYNTEQDLKAKDDNYIATANINVADEFQGDFKLVGNLVEDQANSIVGIDANTITLKLEEEYGDTVQIRGSGSFSIQDLKEDVINIDDEKSINFSNMDAWEIIEIISEIGMKLYQIGVFNF